MYIYILYIYVRILHVFIPTFLGCTVHVLFLAHQVKFPGSAQACFGHLAKTEIDCRMVNDG